VRPFSEFNADELPNTQRFMGSKVYYNSDINQARSNTSAGLEMVRNDGSPARGTISVSATPALV
jgi:hypothetical protein